MNNSNEQHWTTIKSGKEEELTHQVQTIFETYQNESVEVVRTISHRDEITTALQQSSSFRTLFEQLQTLSPSDQTIELFNSSKHLICWNGNEGIQTDTSWLKPSPSSFIVQGPIYSFLAVTNPIVKNTSVAGYVVSKRLFDVNYPISNRFINAEVFTATFTSRLNMDVEFASTSSSGFFVDSNRTTIPLKGLDGETLGSINVPSPALEEEQEQLHRVAQQLLHGLLILLFVTIVAGISSLNILQNKFYIRLLWWTSVLWCTRYVLLWFDIPSEYVHMKIFEPSQFASTFGFGIVKSIGDMFLTSLCLLLNIVLLVFPLYNRQAQSTRTRLHYIGIFIFALGFPLLLRGFDAVVRSAVFDSTLSYFSPTYILPPFSLGVMLVSLFLISLALGIASITGILFSFRVIQSRFPSRSTVQMWLVVSAIFISGNLLFEVLHPNPLFNFTERLCYLAGMLVSAILLVALIEQKKSITKAIIILSIASMCSLLYPLEIHTHEFERSRAEDVVTSMMKPADNYLKILTQQALQELSHSTVLNSFQESTPRVVKKLAFKAWAKSILSREGYNCSVTFYKNDGSVYSQFYLGADWQSPVIHPDSIALKKEVDVTERSLGAHAITVYGGYSPIRSSEGLLEGGVAVEVSTGKQSLLGGETPEFFRNYSTGESGNQSRQYVFSEYVNNELAYSSSETFPLGNQLPTEVRQLSEQQTTIWLEERINYQSYETLYFRGVRSTNGASWYSLSMKQPELGWHLFNVLRIILFYLLFLFVAGSIVGLVLLVQGKRLAFSFRTKLLIAFFVVALIPTAILAYYNRQYAIERAEQSIVEQLKRETTTIASSLQRQWNIFTPFDLTTFKDRHAITVANDVQIDFTVFSDAYEAASSKPELFRAELFDRRMSSDAYSGIVLQQKNFYTNIQTIGTLQYIVGYRPLLSEAGTTFGVVAVPTLFRLQEIDEEIIQRNAFLFGAFLFAMIVALLVGTIFSHQISSPVRRLHLATRKIGAGDFDVKIRSNRTDEFGELEQSFETMLHDLQQSQEETIKAQRELAWKEMAKQVAHEIKNPLTPMKLSIQHLRQAYFDRVNDFDKLLQQVSGTILEQIETLSRIASEFSHFARMPERKIEPCDVHVLLLDVTNLFKEYNDVRFDLQFCPNSPIISADKEELRRAFMNIVRNSIQAMNERGIIAVTSDIAQSMVNITIHDTGPGISELAREHLFEPNFSTKTDGMGLGLALVKKTIDDIGGSITIASETGSGTTVSISLPLSSYQQSGSLND